MAQSILLFTVIKLAGAAYLVYLGVQAIRHRRDLAVVTTSGQPPATSWQRQGFIVDVTNPKTIVFFVAALPQFVDIHAGGAATQMMVLGLVFTLIAWACDSVWALVAGTARAWFATSGERLATLRADGQQGRLTPPRTNSWVRPSAPD